MDRYLAALNFVMKVVIYLALLAALAGLVSILPVLWELALAGAIGGAYWVFFRNPNPEN